MKQTLVIILWLKDNKTMTLDIPNPREDQTYREFDHALFEVLKRDALQNDKGVLAHSLKHAYVRTVTEELLP